MNAIRLAAMALVVGAVTSCSVFAQGPGYDPRYPPPPDPNDYGDQGNHDYYDDRYDRYESWQSPREEVGFFYDQLSPYGDWVMTRDLGWAWFPRYVHSSWRPYSDGRWVYTEYGWTWASYEPFGWATYHYGRWSWDQRFGWLWVPGTEWGPAWVSWQYGGGYVGWAPLPPAVHFSSGFNLRFGGFDLNVGMRSDSYSFVPERAFLDPRLARHLLPTARNISIIHKTANVTDYSKDGNRVMNRGIDVKAIEKATGQKVAPLRVTTSSAAAKSGVSSKEVRIYRPDQQKLNTVKTWEHPAAGSKADNNKAPVGTVDKGQSPVKGQPPTPRRDVPDIRVAPRLQPAPVPDARKLEKQELKQKQDLMKYQADERSKLEKLQRQELAKVKAVDERGRLTQANKAELEALQQVQRDATKQLEARQQLQRQALVPVALKQQGKDQVKRVDEDADKNKKK